MAKKNHGHHGGAWKVAYADFVTAMMALFLVLWLTAQDVKIKEAVERAFRNPFSSVTKESTGVIPNKDVQAVKSSKGNWDSASVVELNMLRKLNEDLSRSLPDEIEDKAQTVKLQFTDDGLRISVFDRSRRPIFDKETAKFTKYGEWVFTTLAWNIAQYKSFDIELEGHTHAGEQALREDYDQWEMSADRANAARRMLVECAWSYQHPPRVGRAKQAKVDAAPPAVREIAWNAQCRLYRRYRALIRKGKRKTVAITAIARELAGFLRAVGRQVTPQTHNQ